MKIGILTFHDTTNFGSLLQTYGLYRFIVDLGFDCDIIDYQCENIVEREIPKPFAFSFCPKHLLREFFFQTTKRKKYMSMLSFLREHMTLSEKCDRTNVKSLNDKYDCFVVGSDIVWGLDITANDTAYFLDFVEDGKKKIAFSSSIGNAWNENEKNLVKPLLKRFNSIAVREEESADWVEEAIGLRPFVVCDPTMLLSAEQWISLMHLNKNEESYVLVYFDNQNGDCKRSAIEYAKRKKISVKCINYTRPAKGVDNVKPLSIQDFLSLIKNADCVFTASYHGLLFSVYFEKQLVYFNRAHKSRMKTIAKKLGIEKNCGDCMTFSKMPFIDYSIVRKKVEQYRRKSIEILKNMLTSNK